MELKDYRAGDRVQLLDYHCHWEAGDETVVLRVNKNSLTIPCKNYGDKSPDHVRFPDVIELIELVARCPEEETPPTTVELTIVPGSLVYADETLALLLVTQVLTWRLRCLDIYGAEVWIDKTDATLYEGDGHDWMAEFREGVLDKEASTCYTG